jgi:hypothetical protein
VVYIRYQHNLSGLSRRFGPRPNDFFTVPDYHKHETPFTDHHGAVSPTTVVSPASIKTTYLLPSTATSLPSFLPSLCSTVENVGVLPAHALSDESRPTLRFVPEPRHSSYGSSFLKLSEPSTVDLNDRHISISSARFPQSPSEYSPSAITSASIGMLAPLPATPGVASRHGGERRFGQATIQNTSDYQFQLSPAHDHNEETEGPRLVLSQVPERTVLGRGLGRGDAIFMTVVKDFE